MENRVKLTSEELLSAGINACKSYSDYNDNIVNLSDEEIRFFNETVELVRKATGYTGSIELAEINEEKGKAVRGCYFPCSGEIFIDTFELHWWHMFHDKNGLIETICHEIAHNKYLYHCKGHRELTEKLVNIVKEFQRKTNTEETANAKTKVKAVRKKEKKFSIYHAGGAFIKYVYAATIKRACDNLLNELGKTGNIDIDSDKKCASIRLDCNYYICSDYLIMAA